MPFPPRPWVNCSDMMDHGRKHKKCASDQKWPSAHGGKLFGCDQSCWEAESLSIGVPPRDSLQCPVHGSRLGYARDAAEKQR